MKFCYCDESGTGEEPIAIMVGIIADAQRMHLTKNDWFSLLDGLSSIVNKKLSEFHTRDFYSGNGIWRGLDGAKRARIISAIIQWLIDRKHDIVYTSVLKSSYYESRASGKIPDELNTLWRFMGFHLILATQRAHQNKGKVRGHTVFVFDNEERERMRFTDLINRPPSWSDEYYSRPAKADSLDQIVDVPYFGDSCEIGLIQLADCISFLLRRYAEIKENLIASKYSDETTKIESWVNLLIKRSVGRQHIYPSRQRGQAESLFFNHAPNSIRTL